MILHGRRRDTRRVAGKVPGPVPVIGGGRRESAGTGAGGEPGCCLVEDAFRAFKYSGEKIA